MRPHPLVANLGLSVLSVLATLGVTEGVLRLRGYRFSPIVFLVPENEHDWRAFHMGATDPRLSTTDPLTLFDPELLWVLNPRVSRQISPQGYRGAEMREPKRPGDFLIVAVGDSNTIGPLYSPDHWPGFLQDLLDQNHSLRRIQVVNAGIPGYTAFQGLKRFQGTLRFHPDLVYFSFGCNDAQPVVTSDARYAARVRWFGGWQWIRTLPPLAHLVWKAADHFKDRTQIQHRVPPGDYKRHLEDFVDQARANGIQPVLLTRPYLGASDDPGHWMTYAPQYNELVRQVAAEKGAACVDVFEEFHDAPELYGDPVHFNRLGHERMAELLLRHLKKMGVVATGDVAVHSQAIDLTQADDRRRELGPGWWSLETQGEWSGRWTQGEALLHLERRGAEAGLRADFIHQSPLKLKRGRVEVEGRPLYDFAARRGRHLKVLDISGIPGRRITVRFVVDPPYEPFGDDPGQGDTRSLGVFVREVRLVGSSLRPSLELSRVEAGQPELGPGWWPPESWPDGRTGRWTRGEAVLWLERLAAEARLIVDLSFQSPTNRTTGRIEVNGTPLVRLDGANGPHTETLDIGSLTGRKISVRFVLDHPDVPGSRDGHADSRTLGVFVHRVRLVDAPALSD